MLALDDEERETLLVALVEPPDGLEEVRGLLLREHGWRVGQGLV